MAEHDAVSRDPLIACAIGFALMGVLLFVIFDKYQALGRQGELPPPIQSAEVIQGPDEAPADSLAPPVEKPPVLAGSTQQLGAFLFTNQLINLELAGLILTIASSIQATAHANIWLVRVAYFREMWLGLSYLAMAGMGIALVIRGRKPTGRPGVALHPAPRCRQSHE